jgi:hypothetical protein
MALAPEQVVAPVQVVQLAPEQVVAPVQVVQLRLAVRFILADWRRGSDVGGA